MAVLLVMAMIPAVFPKVPACPGDKPTAGNSVSPPWPQPVSASPASPIGHPKLHFLTLAWTLPMSGEPVTRYQTECVWNRTVANWSAAASAAPSIGDEPG